MDHNSLPEDQYENNKTIYQAGYGEVFTKNFLAGLGRALGGIFIYVIFLAIVGYYSYTVVYPKIAPLIDQYIQVMNTLTSKPGTGSDAGQYQDLLKQFQQYLPKK